MTQSELEREKYEARLKYQRDELSRQREFERLAHEAEQRGMQRGRQLGQQLGEQRGELLGRVQLAERLLKQAPTPRETLQAMTSEQLQQLAEKLEAQLIGHGQK
jgi:flagellar biosynthesis/type III secretory pathway protein FliH